MPTIDGAAAARTLLGYAPLSRRGACLYYVWLAMKAHGATSATTYPTAMSAWNATTRRHTDKNPPDGATVYFGRRRSDGNMDGDITVALGGELVATDFPSWGGVGRCTIDQRAAQTDRDYLGWSEDFISNTTVIVGSVTGGGATWTATDKQTFLVSLGLDTGGIDGQFGPKSQAATRTFQGWVGITVDGDFGPNTTAKAEVITAGRNATSRATTEIQAKVGTTADGQWGHKTSLAVYRWQAANGLTADAIWGPASDAKAFPPVVVPPVVPPVVVPPVVRSNNPRNLPTYTPVYPGATFGLVAPLGDGPRGFKGSPPVAVPVIIDRFIIHHTDTPGNDQLDYFSWKNDRSSCPTWYLRTDGTAAELIRPKMKPCSTGADWNWRSVAVEVLDVDANFTVSDAQLEWLAQTVAWLAGFDGQELDGVPVDFKIDAAHVLGHRDCVGTECPGDFLYGRIPSIIARAQVIYDAAHTPPVITPESYIIPKADLDAFLAKYTGAAQ